ncbi:putative Endothelin-converting enzyme 1, partial [Operophtera brumata]
KLEVGGIKPIERILAKLNLPPRPPAEIEQVSPGFSERYLLRPEQFAHELQEYRKYIRAMITIADPETDADEFADGIVDFSKALAKIMTPVEVRRSGTHLFHEVNVDQLIVGMGSGPPQWNEQDWNGYLDQVFANTKRFLWWSVFSTVAPMTLSSFRDLGFEFSRAVFGLQQRTPRWKSCTANVNANFGVALSYLYVKRHFDQTSRQKAIEMIEDVRDAFAAAVQELDWMDSTTRLKTLSKLKAIRNFVGFPAWLLGSEQLDKYYKHAIRNFVGFPAWLLGSEQLDKYYKYKILLEEQLEYLCRSPEDMESFKNKLGGSVFVPTSGITPRKYLMLDSYDVFQAVVIEGSLFDSYLNLTWAAVKKSLETLREKPDRNRAINYGSIGAIMGHEVTHGFDDQGTLEHYHGKVQCIIDQYTKYHMPQLPNYTGENIADNGGLRAALSAYSLLARRQPAARRDTLPGLPHYKPDQLFFLGFAQSVQPADTLPGLPHYKPDQLFFLGFAQIWCGNSTVGALKSKMVEGVHSPNKIRVIGTLSNSKEFADAWQCPLGAPMNPQHKCVLW